MALLPILLGLAAGLTLPVWAQPSKDAEMHAAAPSPIAESSRVRSDMSSLEQSSLSEKTDSSSSTSSYDPIVVSAASAVSNTSSSVQVSSSGRAPKPDAHRGIYLTAGSIARADFFDGMLKSVTKADGNALVLDVKGHHVYFDSAAPMARSLGLVDGTYDLRRIAAAAKARGFYIIARYVAVSDAGITAALPETRVKDPKTGRDLVTDYIDPGNPTALAYNAEILCDVAQSGVDEINLDYIRFSTKNFGALKVFSGPEKADHVEKFVRMARTTIDHCDPQVKLGMSTFAILGWDYKKNLETLGQDVVRFAPMVDVISPMAYPATFSQDAYYVKGRDKGSRMYHLVRQTMIGYQKLLGSQAWKLRPWIQGYGVTLKNVEDQMQAVADSDLCGFQFWNAENVYGQVFKGMKTWQAPASCLD